MTRDQRPEINCRFFESESSAAACDLRSGRQRIGWGSCYLILATKGRRKDGAPNFRFEEPRD
jgi:hypothetical protein